MEEIINGDCLEVMRGFSDDSIDLTVTSPPYDNLRDYHGFIFDYDDVANELFRITKEGGVVVWVVADETVNGSETGTSFEQALAFKMAGFNIHDTMIWEKQTFTDTGSLQVRYAGVFEYMFVFSKGKPKTFNPIKDKKNTSVGTKKHGTIRQKDGSLKSQSSLGKLTNEYGQRHNVWKINTEVSNNNRFHPAQFPLKLAQDHIISWSNEEDVVLDPFVGSGTTAIAAKMLNRKYIGIDISVEYCEIARNRLKQDLLF